MKNRTLWIQSCSAESDASIWSTYQDSVRRHARKVAPPEFEVEFHGLSRTYPGIDYLDSAVQLAANEVVRNAIRAEQQGYAAFVFISTNDAGHREVRELTGLPSAFIAEASMNAALAKGGRFAFLTHNAGSRRKMETLAVERFGLADRLVEGASINLTYHDFAGLYRDPAPYLERVEQAARGAVTRGAAVLIPAGGPFNMFLVDHGVQAIAGVPLVDIHAATIIEGVRMIGKTPAAPRRGAATATAEQKQQLRQLFMEQGDPA